MEPRLTKTELKTWKLLENYHANLADTTVIENGRPLFVRLNKEEEIEYIRNAMQK